MASRTLSFLRSGHSGVAQVVEYVESRSDKGSRMYDPRLRLIEPPLGHERTTGSSSSERKWKIGAKLKVKYDPLAPQDYKINSLDDALMGPLILGVIGAVFTIMGLVFLFIFNGPRNEVLWEPLHDMSVEELEAGTAL